ncbi:MAG: RNA 2',3'-cyclic phosphodiesterase [Hyphomicrobiales bacterium]|nr:RNA 2',3'-cyclic phosphodiesterase [Hyphomicrobiales bacterium]
MPRLFAGIELPEMAKAQLSMLRGGLHGAKWVEPANYHITLRFAGDVTNEQAGDFADALADIEAGAFDVEINGLGSFGGDKPRSVWAAMTPCEALLRLQKLTERAARTAGLPPETQNYTPHITLARLNHALASEVAHYLQTAGARLRFTFPVKRFALFSARAHQGGGPYVVEETYSLYGAEGDEEE